MIGRNFAEGPFFRHVLPNADQGTLRLTSLVDGQDRLGSARLLGRSASSPKFFKRFPDMFWLTPDGTPNKVQYIGPTSL